MAKIPYIRPRGSLHDLDAIESLGDARAHLLCVSDRTLYLLGNLSGLDIGMAARWQEERLNDGYIPVSRDSARYDLFLETVNNFQLEVLPVDCDIVASLADISAAIRAIQVQQAAASLACCSYTFDPADYYNPDPAEGDPTNKCALSYSYALMWARGVKEIYHQWSQGAFPALGVLAAILDELGLPGQTLLEIVTLGASNVLPVLEEIFDANVDTLIPNVTCAVYTAQNSTQAKANIYAEIDGLEGINPVVAEMLKAPVAAATLNKVFDGTLPITGEVIPDCQTVCSEGEGDLFQTALVYNFDRLIVGDSTVQHATDNTNGYEGQNSGIRFELYFTPPEAISEWGFAFEAMPLGIPANIVVSLQSFSGGWFTVQQWQYPGTPGDIFTDIVEDGVEIALSPATPYRMLFERQEFNLFAWFRKCIGSSTLF